jgi:hypothetical protein
VTVKDKNAISLNGLAQTLDDPRQRRAERKSAKYGGSSRFRLPSNCGFGVCLQKLAELLDSEPRITNETTHRECIDWIVTRNGEDPLPIGHHDVLALARNPEPRLFEGAHRIEVIDAWDLGQRLYRDLDFANFHAPQLLFNYG